MINLCLYQLGMFEMKAKDVLEIELGEMGG